MAAECRRIFVIAEAGVNHNGSLRLGQRLVDAAAEAGADAVKFQTFRADALVTRNAPKAAYQRSVSGSHWTMLKKLELGPSMHEALFAHCRRRRIEFLSTPFDEGSLDYLVRSFPMKRIKIPSGEIVNGPLLFAAARTGLPVILSTGMSTLKEVRDALRVLSRGYGVRSLAGRVTLLHCVSEYPAPVRDINLRAMDRMRQAFGLPVGLSDHTAGIAVAIAAAARGASVIEKHFTLDRALKGPDHRASLLPRELDQMVRSIRQVQAALGDAVKRPALSERKNRSVSRKSLVAARPIKKGEPFTTENLTAKRPGNGVSPMRYWDFLGKRAGRDYAAEEIIHR